jgi:hypothetical protein
MLTPNPNTAPSAGAQCLANECDNAVSKVILEPFRMYLFKPCRHTSGEYAAPANAVHMIIHLLIASFRPKPTIIVPAILLSQPTVRGLARIRSAAK